MSAIKQWYLYHRAEKRGASDAWCRAGKERALAQIKVTMQDALELIAAIICALIISAALYILTGGR